MNFFRIEMIYETDGPQICAHACLARCVPPESITKPPAFFKTLKKLISYIETNNLPIQIISNTFGLNSFAREGEPIYWTNKIGNREFRCEAFLLDAKNTAINYIYKPPSPKHTLIFDENSRRVETGVPTLKPNVYLSHGGSIIFNGKVLFTPLQLAKAASQVRAWRKWLEYKNFMVFLSSESAKKTPTVLAQLIAQYLGLERLAVKIPSVTLFATTVPTFTQTPTENRTPEINI